MRAVLIPCCLAILTTSVGAANPASAAQSQQARTCSTEADHKALTGDDRRVFLRSCMKGSLSPRTPTSPQPRSVAALAVTQPSGVDRTVRSKQCSDEADRRGLAGSQRNAFRLSCLASAAPASATGTALTPPAATRDKPALGTATTEPSSQPHR